MKKYIVVFFLIFISPVHAALQVSVSGGDFNPIAINIASFSGDEQLANSLKTVIVNDLNNSGLFSTNVNLPQYFVSGKVNTKNNQISVEYILQNTIKRQILAKKIEVPSTLWRYAAHKIADKIYNNLTGENPYFTSKILFVDESGDALNIVKRIAIIDQDGANLHYLTNGDQLVVTPKISHNQKLLSYTGYVNDTPLTYLQEIKTGKRAIVGLFKNGTIAPNFSPTGLYLVMSLLKENGNSNLFKLNIKDTIDSLNNNSTKSPTVPIKQNLKRLTYGESIDSVSCFSSDGKKIVFSSDRSGQQKLYVMDINGANLKQISKNKGSYSTPSWSPHGNYIAFTKKTSMGFSIGIMRPDGSDERILTTSFHSERPCWSPNGRIIVFFKEVSPGNHKLYSIDITGRNEKMVPTPNGASDPDWIAS